MSELLVCRYANMKPAPAQRAASKRSGGVIGKKQVGVSGCLLVGRLCPSGGDAHRGVCVQTVRNAVASSMSGGDGKAPWNLKQQPKVHKSPLLLSGDWSAFPVLKVQEVRGRPHAPALSQPLSGGQGYGVAHSPLHSEHHPDITRCLTSSPSLDHTHLIQQLSAAGTWMCRWPLLRV